mmetsp:Transcript_68438/g.162276  ORF Transcript_68438/g.162276 Transcript_68438/m.162276 type:complete len:330 (-) Transcript_68438:77-1066(-)
MSCMTSLHQAARDGNVELVNDILVGQGGQMKVSIDAVTTGGQTPLHIAAKWGRLGVVNALVEGGANVSLQNDRGMTALDVAKDASVKAFLGKQSHRKVAELDEGGKALRREILLLSAQCEAGEITDQELDDALQRLEVDRERDRERGKNSVRDFVAEEEKEANKLDQVVDYLDRRPKELHAENHAKGQELMRRREKEERKLALEQARLDRIAAEEARRLRAKDKEDKAEKKDLQRMRKCGKCAQDYSNGNNRGGQCVHKGEWANWGKDSHGNKVEWQFFWTCCKSEQHEGPAGGCSICARSDPHEESNADIARRMAKARKKIAESAAAK